MDKKEEIFAELRKNNVRITKQRRAIIDVLESRHLTIQEIHSELKKRGFRNLGTVYNNIDFLQEHKIITQIFINGKKHYDLTIDDTSHTADSHIHVTCRINNKIIEINNSDLFEIIKNHPIFEGFDIAKIQVVVEGECKNHDGKNCKISENCFLNNIEKQTDSQ